MYISRESSSFDQLEGAAGVLHGKDLSGEGEVPLDEATHFAGMIKDRMTQNKDAITNSLVSLKSDPSIAGDARNGLLLTSGIVTKYLSGTDFREVFAEFGIAGGKESDEVRTIVNPIKGKKTLPSFIKVLDLLTDLNLKKPNQGDREHVTASLAEFYHKYEETRKSPRWGVMTAALTNVLDRVATELEKAGHEDLASDLDVVSNSLAAMEETEKPITAQGTPSPEQDNTTQEITMSNKYAMLKQAHEMQAQAYDMLAKASGILNACGVSDAIGDPARAQIVAPAAPSVVVTTDGIPVAPVAPPMQMGAPAMPGAGGEGVIMLDIGQKTASLAILDKVAAELASSRDPGLRKLASEVLAIAADLDKTAKVIEDGFVSSGTTDIRYVNEMEQGFSGGVLEDGTGGGQGGKAVSSFKTDRHSVVSGLPFVKNK